MTEDKKLSPQVKYEIVGIVAFVMLMLVVSTLRSVDGPASETRQRIEEIDELQEKARELQEAADKQQGK